MQCSSRIRCHHQLTTFHGGWRDTQLADGTSSRLRYTPLEQLSQRAEFYESVSSVFRADVKTVAIQVISVRMALTEEKVISNSYQFGRANLIP